MDLTIPPSIRSVLAGKRFALVGFGAADAAAIAAIFESVNAFARAVAPPQSASAYGLLAPYDVCIFQAASEAAPGAAAAAELAAQTAKPAMLIGTRDDVMRQAALLRALVHDFLLAPWEAGDLLLRSYRVLSQIGEGAHIDTADPEGLSRVLVADDDTTVRTMVATILRNYQIKCETAHDGAEAVEMIRAFAPSTAILDINMPRMDGFEVLASLKGDPATRAIRVLMLSGRQHETDVVRGFSLGADDYVSKPFSPMELVARVKRMLPHGRLRPLR